MVKTSDQHTLKLFVDTVQQLSMSRDMDSLMRIVRTAARRLTGADGATFVLRDKDMCFYADEDAVSKLWKGSRFPISNCISGWSMLHREAVVIKNIFEDQRIPHDIYRRTFVKSLTMVPIRMMDPIGAIGAYWADYHEPTNEEVNLLQSLADITAVTIENINIYRELEQRVKQRTEELEAANKELEAFSFSVSHDLRAPLRSIMGYADILKEDNFDELNDSGKHALGVVRQNAVKMNTLIDDLLQFARFARSSMEKSDVNMEELVQAVARESKVNPEKKPTFNWSEIHSAPADKNLIQQVWINLISNAIKYSSKVARPVIEIGSYKNDNEVVYIVKDNGAGFNMDYASKLFFPFQRLHAASEFPGSGVGLALAQRIVTRHGGRVWAEGAVNEGATFYFSLPLSA